MRPRLELLPVKKPKLWAPHGGRPRRTKRMPSHWSPLGRPNRLYASWATAARPPERSILANPTGPSSVAFSLWPGPSPRTGKRISNARDERPHSRNLRVSGSFVLATAPSGSTRSDQERITLRLDHLTPSITGGTLSDAHFSDRPSREGSAVGQIGEQKVHRCTSGRTGFAYSRTGNATTASKIASPRPTRD